VSTAIVLLAHGSRDPDWSIPLERIARRVRERCPGADVGVAYLEISPPTLGDAVAALAAGGAAAIVVVPLFFAPGAHVRRDLPQLVDAVRGRYPGVTVRVLPTVGEAEPLLDAIAAWIAEASR
jgi:sirohydrochlorin cobaltochelatase